MPDDRRYSNEDTFIRRLDPDYLALVADVRGVKSQMSELKVASDRTERYLVGGWNENGEWVAGLRDEIKASRDATAGLETKVEDTRKTFASIKAGVWAIVLILVGIFGKGLFDLFPIHK